MVIKLFSQQECINRGSLPTIECENEQCPSWIKTDLITCSNKMAPMFICMRETGQFLKQHLTQKLIGRYAS